MWLQMGDEEGAPLVYLHRVKHMWVGYTDGLSGASDEGAEAEEWQARQQVLTAQKVKPKEAVLWMQMQREMQLAACLDSTSRTVEVWGPTRQVVALALYVGETVHRSRGRAGEWDPDTEMQRVRKVMAMVDYGGAWGGTKGTLYKWCPHRQVPQERRTMESLTWCKMDSLGGLWSPRGTGARR